MTILLFANNASTTLSAPLSPSSTSISLSPGTGAEFPNPSAGQGFLLTFVDAATGLINEIVLCTARSGDTCTVVRGQEGTTAKSWLAGDIAANFCTAGTQAGFVQADQLQNGYYSIAGSVGGTVNAITATLPSNLTSIPAGMSVRFLAAGANTGAVTFNLTLGSTPTGALAVVDGSGNPLLAGAIPSAGFPVMLGYNATLNKWQINNMVTNALSASLFTAKGDLLVGTGAGTASALGVGSDGAIPVAQSGDANGMAYTGLGFAGIAAGLSASVASSALTVALKTAFGVDPSAASPVYIPFRSATLGNGTYSFAKVTGALSVTVPSGAKLGSANGVPFRFWIVAFNNAGSVVLALINCLSGFSIFPLQASDIASATGITSGSNSAQTFYGASAVASMPYRVLGYLEYSSGLTAAGTYATAPTKVTLFGPDIPLPGKVVQEQPNATGAYSTLTSSYSATDTPPAPSNTTVVASTSITPTSACNLLKVEANAVVGNDGSVVPYIGFTAIFQDSATTPLATSSQTGNSSHTVSSTYLKAWLLANTMISTTFKMALTARSGPATYFNGGGEVGAGRIFGGTSDSFITVQEIAA